MAGASNKLRGKIVRLNIEENDGIIRIDGPEVAGRPTEVHFQPSALMIDQRYISEVTLGMQVEFIVDEDRTTRALSACQVRPLDDMVYEGVVSSIHRRDGLAEVTVVDLDTTIVFCQTHLDDPEEFSRVREGDQVRIDIGFYNFVSKRKPPRANKVVLLNAADRENVRLRPALRRSSSVSRNRPKSVDEDNLVDATARRRSSSQGSGSRFHPASAPLTTAELNQRFPPNCPAPWERSRSPLLSATAFFQMPPCGRFSFMAPPAGWLPSPPYNFNFGAGPAPFGGVPAVLRLPGRPAGAGAAAAAAPAAAAAGVAAAPVAAPVTPPPRPGPSSPLGAHVSPHGSRSRSSSNSRPSSSMSHPEAFFGFAPESELDDSEVVLEMTVNELRDLMRQRPR